MFIQAHGLHHGERLRKCSDEARLWWPYLFLAANSYGRMRLSYARFLSDVAVDFNRPPAEDEYWALFKEYRDRHLAFLYQHGEDIWCQWFCAPGTLPQYETKEDRETPKPPAEAYERWKSSYVKQTKPLAAASMKILKISYKTDIKVPQGIGSGIGSGSGIGVLKESAKDKAAAANTRPPNAPPPLLLEDIRDTLHDYVRQSGIEWPPPDDALCRQVQSIWLGTFEGLGETLAGMLKRNRKPSESYAWFLTVLRKSG